MTLVERFIRAALAMTRVEYPEPTSTTLAMADQRVEHDGVQIVEHRIVEVKLVRSPRGVVHDSAAARATHATSQTNRANACVIRPRCYRERRTLADAEDYAHQEQAQTPPTSPVMIVAPVQISPQTNSDCRGPERSRTHPPNT
jgi:hypothetical protein